jgi:hypothetical protein
MATLAACMRLPLSQLLSGAFSCQKSALPIWARAFSAASQPTGRTGSGSATNVSGQKGEEAAAEEGAPPPDSAFDGGGAAGSTMGKKEDTKGESGHMQNFDKEAGPEGGKAATGTKGTRQYSTLAVMHASPVSSSALHRGMQGMMGFYQRYSSSVETPHIDKEKATQDKDILRSASGGAAMEDKEPDEDPKEGTSPWGGEGEQVVHKGGDKGVGRQMGGFPRMWLGWP